MMRASMTAYSTAVAASSPERNLRIAFMARPAGPRGAWLEFVVKGCTSVRLGMRPSNSAWPECLVDSATFQARPPNRQGTYNQNLLKIMAFTALVI
jgi:hypothetical protein